jgi:hypothetical protein
MVISIASGSSVYPFPITARNIVLLSRVNGKWTLTWHSCSTMATSPKTTYSRLARRYQIMGRQAVRCSWYCHAGCSGRQGGRFHEITVYETFPPNPNLLTLSHPTQPITLPAAAGRQRGTDP